MPRSCPALSTHLRELSGQLGGCRSLGSPGVLWLMTTCTVGMSRPWRQRSVSASVHGNRGWGSPRSLGGEAGAT